MKTNTIVDPISGEILEYDKLFLGQRQVVTPEELKNYEYAPMSGVVKGLDGTLVDITKIYQTFGEAKTEGGDGTVPAHNHDSVYSKLGHAHEEYSKTEDVYTKEEVYKKEEIDTLLENNSGGSSVGCGYSLVGSIAGSLYPACYDTVPANPLGGELYFECKCLDKDGNYIQIYSKKNTGDYPGYYHKATISRLQLSQNSNTSSYYVYKYNNATGAWDKQTTTYYYVNMNNNPASVLYSNLTINYLSTSDVDFAGELFYNVSSNVEQPINSFDNATKNGFYDVAIVNSDVLNAPTAVENAVGFLEVLSNRSIFQRFTTEDGTVYTRMCVNNIWTSWV